MEKISALIKELDQESDRALAVLMAAYLDVLLGDLLISRMAVPPAEAVKLLMGGETAPLSSFSSKIRMAYCLGVLSEDERADLELIRKIRNKFAHDLAGLSFETQPIVDHCRHLRGVPSSEMSSAKQRFSVTAFRLIVAISSKTRGDEAASG